MSQVEESLRVRRFEHPPSAEDFSSLIEPSNAPAVFNGAIKDWEALSRWNPSTGGLDYLQELAGSATVEAMLSKAAPVFYGDIRSHERVPLPFSMFITSCKLHLCNTDIGTDSSFAKGIGATGTSPSSDEACLTSVDSLDQLYLAQVPILNMDSKEICPLHDLRKDIQVPMFVKAKQISSINLWMNKAQSRSSIHYDPHHNLLCIIAGCKQVVLCPPSASASLYPMPIYGEASNHSAVNIENPDLLNHPRAKHLAEHSQKVILYPGDALFIPEGWFHQVDSDDLTIAVNFWWKSNLMSSMLEHMDAYYLRRILNSFTDTTLQKRLLENEKDKMLSKTSVSISKQNDEVSDSSKDNNLEDEHNGMSLDQLEPSALLVLHELISLVHNSIDLSSQKRDESESVEVSNSNVKDALKLTRPDNSLFLENDPIACIFRNAEPLVLRKVFLAMTHYFPRTLEALILHMLSPTGAEVLTRKFDEMDQKTTKLQQSAFYQMLYSVFEDQRAAMDAILNGKERFAFQAFRNVLDLYLGVNYANSDLS